MYLNVKQKKQINPKAVIFISAVLVVLVVFVTGTVMLLTKGKEIKDSLIKMPFTAEDEYFSVENNIVYASNNTITCADISLKEIKKIQLESNVLQYTSGNSLFAAASEDILMVFNKLGDNLFSTRLNGTISSVRLGKDKVAVATGQTLENKAVSYIVVFGLDGSSLFQLDISGKYVLDYGFDADNRQLYILELDVTGTVPISRVTTYRPDTKSMTGIKELKDQLIGSVYFGETAVFTMGTKQLTEYSSLNTEGKEILVYGWVLEDICEKPGPKFVYVPGTSNTSIDITRIIKPSGDEVKINLPPGVFKILAVGEKIYCFASNNIFVYTGEGKYLRKYDIPFAADEVRRAMEGYVFLKAGRDVYLLPLP